MAALNNYRPITLLNFTYKVLTRVMADRMKSVLHLVISPEQYGFIPGRRLSDAVAMVADIIDTAKNHNEDWYLLLVDFQKAFDLVSRDFLFEVLEKMGFPQRFVGWIKGLHQYTKMKLLINGWLGQGVDVVSGVRQGCPLALYLFLCALEPLALEVEKRKLGLEKEGHRLGYLGYADDTTLVLQGRQHIAEAEEVLDKFEKAAGLATNKSKSVVLPLGANLKASGGSTSVFKWAGADDAERLLGVWVTPSGNVLLTWEKAMGRIMEKLTKRHLKYLTILALTTVVNNYITRLLAFQAQVHPPPAEIWVEISCLLHGFTSGNRVAMAKGFILWSKDLLFTPRADDGIGVRDPEVVLSCLAAKRVARSYHRGQVWRRRDYERRGGSGRQLKLLAHGATGATGTRATVATGTLATGATGTRATGVTGSAANSERQEQRTHVRLAQRALGQLEQRAHGRLAQRAHGRLELLASRRPPPFNLPKLFHPPVTHPLLHL
ncbi:unnamed protein product [Closterium sp. NIES-53]